MKLPLNSKRGTAVEDRVGLVDVAPTILQVAGLPIPKEMQGEALIRPAKAHESAAEAKKAADDRILYAETDYPHRGFGWSSLRAIRTDKYLYVQAPEPELYNQQSDPGELQNLAANSKAVAETLGGKLQQFREKTSQSLNDLAKPDPDQIKKLEALGYVGSDWTDSKQGKNMSGADPKQKIQISNLLHDAMFLVEDARYEEAIPLLTKVLQDAPDMPVANMQYGMAQARLRKFKLAVAPLEKAVEKQPDNGMGHYELGLALFETGDWKSAAPQFEAAVGRAPRWADAHFSLAAVYARIDRVPDAMTELDTALTLSPHHYRANLLRGRILSLQGNPAAAVLNLETAAQVQPDSREAHLFLADTYSQLGRVMDAAKERVAAEQLVPAPK
jgi:tetratricopeptide (TPR) repeat protein